MRSARCDHSFFITLSNNCNCMAALIPNTKPLFHSLNIPYLEFPKMDESE